MKPKAAASPFWSFLLLFLWTATTSAGLRVTVSPSVIHAKPGSNVMLPCHISGTPKPIDLKSLAVNWLKGSNVIATYEDKFETNRPGAQMAIEKLEQEGDATLLLPRVQDTDDGVYTCSVIYVPDTADAKVELRVEVPPQLTHGPTKLQLGKPSNVTCLASDFYPGDIFVTWLQDSKIVKGPEQAIAHLTPEGLFNAESVLELVPQIVDDNATISCQVNHKAIKEPLRENFQLQVQAPPILEVVTVPSEKTFCAAQCLVKSFFPREINIQWLRNGIPQELFKTETKTMTNGTFSIKSAVFLLEMDVKVTYTCRVQHESLATPLEKEVLLLPKGEGNDVTHHTPLSSQSPEKKQTSQSACSTVISLCPTDSSTLGTSVSHLSWLYGIIGLISGLVLGAVAVLLIFKNKAKNTTAPGSKSEGLLKNIDGEMNQDTSKLKTESADVWLGCPRGHLEKGDKEHHQNMQKDKTEEPHEPTSML